MLPKVSVIITNYNYAEYVQSAIDSVVRQTYKNIECVVIDDCSTDASFEIICDKITREKLGHFRAIRLGRNSGQMTGFRAGLENSDGPFVVFLDADDVLERNFVETHVAVHLNSTRSASMTASNTLLIAADGSVMEGNHFLFGKRSDWEPKFEDVPASSIPVLRNGAPDYTSGGRKIRASFRRPQRHGWPYSATSSFMFRRDAATLFVSEATDKIRICADWYLVHMVSAAGGSILIHELLGRYRYHQTNNFARNLVVGGLYTSRIAASGDLLRQIDEFSDRFVHDNWRKLSQVLDDSFFRAFPTPVSSTKQSLLSLWDRLPRPVQLAVMPLADAIDRWVK